MKVPIYLQSAPIMSTCNYIRRFASHKEFSTHIRTSQLICYANKLNGFYISGIMTWNGLNSVFKTLHVIFKGTMKKTWKRISKNSGYPKDTTGYGTLNNFVLTGWIFEHDGLIRFFGKSWHITKHLVIENKMKQWQYLQRINLGQSFLKSFFLNMK